MGIHKDRLFYISFAQELSINGHCPYTLDLRQGAMKINNKETVRNAVAPNATNNIVHPQICTVHTVDNNHMREKIGVNL
jgi:hypothetical protein